MISILQLALNDGRERRLHLECSSQSDFLNASQASIDEVLNACTESKQRYLSIIQGTFVAE